MSFELSQARKDSVRREVCATQIAMAVRYDSAKLVDDTTKKPEWDNDVDGIPRAFYPQVTVLEYWLNQYLAAGGKLCKLPKPVQEQLDQAA